MIPRDKLEQLQFQCKGQGKQNLYDLLGVPGAPPGHQDLRKRLDRKRDSWSKMADKAAHLQILELASDLLQTPSDQAEYDRFLQSQAEPQAPPVSPQQQSWGHEQSPIPPPPHRQQPVPPKPRAGLGINAKLVMVGLALVALSLLMTGTPLWDIVGQPGTTAPEDGTGSEPDDPPTPPSGPSPSDPPEIVTTPPPAPDDPPLADPPHTPVAPPAGPDDVPSPTEVGVPAPTSPPPAPDPVVSPQPVVEPVRVGGGVARPRKTWNVQPEYPCMARLRRIQGLVILEVTVDRQGNVSNVSVLQSVEGLGEAAVEAVRRWRYEPTIIGGRPVSVVFTETVMFQL